MVNEILLEDDDILVLLPKKSFCQGHLQIFVKGGFAILDQVPNPLFQKMMQIANKLSSVLFETLGAQGTNLLVQNGVSAGQSNPNFCVNVIPRFENDGLVFDWPKNQADESTLSSVVSTYKNLDAKIAEQALIEKKKKMLAASSQIQTNLSSNSSNQNPDGSANSSSSKVDKKEVNYQVKSLNRLP